MVLPKDNPVKSYWIQAAKSELRDLRSTAELPTETDIVIIGSGYTGAATAYWLHKHTIKHGTTPRMLMLEARDICGGATGRNGGQLRPHAYSRYPTWASRFGKDVALDLIRHEMAHLSAFKELLEEEGIAEKVCFKLGDTFDAAMTDEAWVRLKGAYEQMNKDHGKEAEAVGKCRIIEDAKAAEEFTQMKGTLAAIVHPSGQVWPYKFVHALLEIVLQTGKVNIQAHTPVEHVSEPDKDGFITVKTTRGDVKTRAVMHGTNRWASHVLPEFSNLIFPARATLAALQGPEGFIKNTGAQHWDSVVNNYHLQIPPPYNTIIIGGARQVLSHDPAAHIRSDSEDKQFHGVAGFFQSWPARDIVDWTEPTKFALPVDEGGCWTGVESSSIDSFPFVGALPNHSGQFIAAGFTGHGMPRILLSAAHVTPLILEFLRVEHTAPHLTASYPALPGPFYASAERIQSLQKVDAKAKYEAGMKADLESAQKPICNIGRHFLGLA